MAGTTQLQLPPVSQFTQSGVVSDHVVLLLKDLPFKSFKGEIRCESVLFFKVTECCLLEKERENLTQHPTDNKSAASN